MHRAQSTFVRRLRIMTVRHPASGSKNVNRCCGACQAHQVPGCSEGSKGRPDLSTP
jgi:hypothetical protein